MDKTIRLEQRDIVYKLVLARKNKKIRISLKAGGAVRVSAPITAPVALIERFMREKSRWILTKHDELRAFPPRDEQRSKEEYKKYKQQALDLAQQKIAHFGTVYNLTPSTITVKNHKTLWGSCSRRGNLNFNYKIALLPEPLCDYIIVHELCHLKEFNHSQDFWDLVSKTIPDHKNRRQQLKKWGLGLS